MDYDNSDGHLGRVRSKEEAKICWNVTIDDATKFIKSTTLHHILELQSIVFRIVVGDGLNESEMCLIALAVNEVTEAFLMLKIFDHR